VSLKKSQIHDLIIEAEALVADEEEPFKIAAFQVILAYLMSNSPAVESGTKKAEASESDETPVKLLVPEEKINWISGLGDPDKIPLLWSMASKEWMKVDEFLSAITDLGLTIAKSWSPKQGGNFNNRLFKEKKLFVKKGEGKEVMYKLSAEGKQRVSELLKETKPN
jgi:hypothetical protein